MALSIKSAKTLNMLQRCTCLTIAAVLLSSCAQKESKQQQIKQADMADYFATADESIARPEAAADTSVVEEDNASAHDKDGINPDVFSAATQSDVATQSTSSVAPILKMTEYQKDAQGLRIIGTDGQPLIVLKVYNAELIKSEIYSLEQFGPNPYHQQAPRVADDVKVIFEEVVADLASGKLEHAEQQLKKLIDEQPTLSGPAYNLALLKYQQKDLNQAAEYSKLALERNYYNQDARNLSAIIAREKGDFATSEALHKENLTVWGGYTAGYRNLGILYDLYLGKPEVGLPYYYQYNALQSEEDRLVLGWTMDIERRLTAKHEAFVREQQLQNQAATAQANEEADVANLQGQDINIEEADDSELEIEDE